MEKLTRKINKKNGKIVKFEIEAEPNSEVYLAGTFNNWDTKANKLRKYKNKYTTSIVLPKGRHEYKFIINNIWYVDPKSEDWQPNGMGSINSVINVE